MKVSLFVLFFTCGAEGTGELVSTDDPRAVLVKVQVHSLEEEEKLLPFINVDESNDYNMTDPLISPRTKLLIQPEIMVQYSFLLFAVYQ